MSKYLFGCCLFLLACSSVWSQDTLVKRNGERVLVKVLEVNPSDIRYKRFNHLDGPLYIINKSEIAFIAYPDGLHETYEQAAPPPPTIVVNTPPAIVDKRLYRDGNEYLLNGRRLGERDLFAELDRQKNPEVKLLLKQTKNRKAAQYALGAGGLVLGVASIFVITGGPQFLVTSQSNASAEHGTLTAGLLIAQVALLSEVASLVFKIERRDHTALLLNAYNDSLGN